MGRIRSGKSTKADKTNPVADKARDLLPGDPGELHGPSPNPHTNLLIADLALRGGTLLARRAVERGLLGSKYAPRKAKAIMRGRTFGETRSRRSDDARRGPAPESGRTRPKRGC